MSGNAQRLRLFCVRAAALAAGLLLGSVQAQVRTPPPRVAAAPADDAASATVQNSALDTPLFHQLLIAEIELRSGRPAVAADVMLDAAMRQGDEALFQRAVDMALQARSAEQALRAVAEWRRAKPQSVAPLRLQTQVLTAMNRSADAIEPLSAWLALAPTMDRPGLIAGLPRLLQRLPDRQDALAAGERMLAPYRDAPGTRTASRLTLARLQQAAGHSQAALALARSAQADDPAAPTVALLALELLPSVPEAQALVDAYLAQPAAEPAIRMAYARALAQTQRHGAAVRQLEQVARERPQQPETWLALGGLLLELHQPKPAENALQRYLALVDGKGARPSDATTPDAEPPADNDDDAAEASSDNAGAAGDGRSQAWLLLAQAAEQRGDIKAAEQWLAKVDSPQRLLEVQARRAALLLRQGKVAAARALVQATPERTGDDARAKLLVEAQVLREGKLWREAGEVLAAANQRFADDSELLYEQAMVEEKLGRWDAMEALLRRVIALKPDHAHAHNALGYSLADRGLRLPEAQALIQRALVLSPGDPFIIDSLGWVEFRLGNRDEALRLLRQAYAARPDVEIAVHLGEVLWAHNQRDEARRIWREAIGRDAGNELLRDTLARLKVRL